jgi:hypothetical protein
MIEVPKGKKHAAFLNVPELETFAKSEKDRKLMTLQRAFRLAASPLFSLPANERPRCNNSGSIPQNLPGSGVPQGIQKGHRRRPNAAHARSPERVIKEIPRDPEIVGIFKKLQGADPLPSR